MDEAQSRAETGESLSPRIARATAAIAVIAISAKLLSFVEKQALAYYFGAGEAVDAFFVASSVPFLFFLMVRELIEPAFLPLFARNLGAGREQRAWRFFTAVALLVVVVTSLYAAYASIDAEAVARRLAPGFGPEAVDRASRLIRLTVPAVVPLGLSALTYITLNGYRRFALPAAGDLLLKAAPLVTCLLLVERLGILAFAVGFLVGAGARLGVHLLGLRGELKRVRPPDAESREDLVLFGGLLLPLVVGAGFSFLSELADNYFSSQVGAGGVSARAFAKKLRDLPIEILPYTLSVVLFPFFTSLFAAGDTRRLARLFATAVHGLAMAFAPLAVVMVLLAEPLVSLALERGAFDASARTLTASVLAMYGLGMVTFAVETVLVNLFFALRDTRTPVAVGLLGVATNVGLTALLIEPLGVAGVALALSASKSLKVAVLALLLPRRGPFVRWGTLAAGSLRLAGAAAVAALAVHVFATRWAIDLAAASAAEKALHLCLGGAVGAVPFFGVLAVLGRRERALLSALPDFVASIGVRR